MWICLATLKNSVKFLLKFKMCYVTIFTSIAREIVLCARGGMLKKLIENKYTEEKKRNIFHYITFFKQLWGSLSRQAKQSLLKQVVVGDDLHINSLYDSFHLVLTFVREHLPRPHIYDTMRYITQCLIINGFTTNAKAYSCWSLDRSFLKKKGLALNPTYCTVKI